MQCLGLHSTRSDRKENRSLDPGRRKISFKKIKAKIWWALHKLGRKAHPTKSTISLLILGQPGTIRHLRFQTRSSLLLNEHRLPLSLSLRVYSGARARIGSRCSDRPPSRAAADNAFALTCAVGWGRPA